MLEADVAVIGGGPAGLSAALLLGRSMRSVVVIDEDAPRHAAAARSHGYLTRDGIRPSEFRRLAREELAMYDTVSLLRDSIAASVKADGMFRSKTAAGLTIMSRKLIVAAGLKDRLPDVPGLREAYGTSVFPCPYCDGWERRDRPLAVLGSGNPRHLMDYVKKIAHWSRDLIVCCDGAGKLGGHELAQLEENGIAVYEQRIAKLITVRGQLETIVLQDGKELPRSGGFLADTGSTQSTDVPLQLGARLTDNGAYETEAHGRTPVDGLYIAGDAAKLFTGLAGAAAEGYEAAATVDRELIEEDWAKRCR